MATKTGGGGGGQTKKQLALVFVVIVTLVVHTPSGVGAVVAAILICATIFAVFHNGVQIIDAIVFFTLGVFLASTYVGEGANNIVHTIATWFAQTIGG